MLTGPAGRTSGRRVGEHIEGFAVILKAVIEQPGAQCLGTLPMPLEFLDRGDTEVLAPLHRYVFGRPGGWGGVRLPLDGQDPIAVLIKQHQPVIVVGGAGGRRLLPRRRVSRASALPWAARSRTELARRGASEFLHHRVAVDLPEA
jgi:hypothetical protein